jgi:hypothetical protein
MVCAVHCRQLFGNTDSSACYNEWWLVYLWYIRMREFLTSLANAALGSKAQCQVEMTFRAIFRNLSA